jgi:hypothetical protein
MKGVVDPDQQPIEPIPAAKKAARRTPFRWAKFSRIPRRPYERKHPLDWAVFVLLLLTTVATGFAAYYTHNQWMTAQDTEKRQLRAYILVDRDHAHIRANTQVTDLEMAIKNYGQTPAYIREGAAWLGILEWPFLCL